MKCYLYLIAIFNIGFAVASEHDPQRFDGDYVNVQKEQALDCAASMTISGDKFHHIQVHRPNKPILRLGDGSYTSEPCSYNELIFGCYEYKNVTNETSLTNISKLFELSAFGGRMTEKDVHRLMLTAKGIDYTHESIRKQGYITHEEYNLKVRCSYERK